MSPAQEARIDPALAPWVVPIGAGGPLVPPGRPAVAADVRQWRAAAVPTGTTAQTVLVASSPDLLGQRLLVRDAARRPVSSTTRWVQPQTGQAVDPDTFVAPGTDLAKQIALAMASVPGSRGFGVAQALAAWSFTTQGDGYFEVVSGERVLGFAVPARYLSAQGVAAAAVAIAPAPVPAAPAVDCAVAKCIALTFDDGPSQYTGALLEIFASYGGQATFFLLGSKAADPDNAATLDLMRAGGHLVGNHSWDHPRLPQLSSDQVASQLVRTRDALAPWTSGTPRYFRPPYGLTDPMVNGVAASLGYPVILWSVDPSDYRHTEPQPTVDGVLGAAARNAIVLSHDTLPATLEAYRQIVPALVSQGYTLVPLDALIGQPAPGAVVRYGN
jgi:peptidoglycan/xylan/chitin deacetylase (PgdA/CDA1 family)